MDHATIGRLIGIPVMSAVTGYITNAVAVWMLFHPRREMRFLGFRFQGLIPKRRSEIAQSIGETIEKHLISHEDIRKVLARPDVARQIHGMFDERIDKFLKERVRGLIPVVGMLLNDSLLNRIKSVIMDEIMSAVPSMTENIIDDLEENLDFKKTIVERIEGFDLERLENIVRGVSSSELRAIEVLGGVLGLFIGLLTDLLVLF
jgi:uncharacterized membrane protein YheB (UPF0754 family)